MLVPTGAVRWSPRPEERQGRIVAREMINTIVATVVSVTDESYGGFERDGQVVEEVRRRGVYVLQGFGFEPIGPLMATLESDVALADELRGGEQVQVRVATSAVNDQYKKAHLKHGSPKDAGPVFVGAAVDAGTGELVGAGR